MTAKVEKLPLILIASGASQAHQPLLGALPSYGFKVALAKDGVLGYHKAQVLLPKLILLDAELPKLDSLSLIRMLQSLPLTAHTPIFLLSAKHNAEECINALKAGAVDYISSPYAVEELIERIRTHVRLAHERNAFDPHTSQPVEQDKEAPENHRPIDLMLVRVAKEVIGEQLSNPPTQKELAQMFGVSQRKLIEAFKNCLGISVGDYIRQQRMRKAEYFLVNTTLTLSYISDELGFSSPANFATAFRMYSGLTPREYRNSAKRQSPIEAKPA